MNRQVTARGPRKGRFGSKPAHPSNGCMSAPARCRRSPRGQLPLGQAGSCRWTMHERRRPLHGVKVKRSKGQVTSRALPSTARTVPPGQCGTATRVPAQGGTVSTFARSGQRPNAPAEPDGFSDGQSTAVFGAFLSVAAGLRATLLAAALFEGIPEAVAYRTLRCPQCHVRWFGRLLG